VNHSCFPEEDHLPDGARRDNQVQKGDHVEQDPIYVTNMNIPYFPTDNAHLMYNAHPKLFYIPFEVQITRT